MIALYLIMHLFFVLQSTVNKGTNSLVKDQIGVGKMVRYALSHNERHIHTVGFMCEAQIFTKFVSEHSIPKFFH